MLVHAASCLYNLYLPHLNSADFTPHMTACALCASNCPTVGITCSLQVYLLVFCKHTFQIFAQMPFQSLYACLNDVATIAVNICPSNSITRLPISTSKSSLSSGLLLISGYLSSKVFSVYSKF